MFVSLPIPPPRANIRTACLTALTLALALGVSMGAAGAARATYPGFNGAIARESFNTNAGTVTATVRAGSLRIASCQNGCSLGAPSYSPDGRTIVVSRSGSLMLVGADGTGAHSLPRQTANDEKPAFLPSGSELVFDGRTSRKGKVNLFTVGTNGTGLRQLTHGGGSEPAPCANGAIAFVKRGDVYLIGRDRRSGRRITFHGGYAPSCSPGSGRIAFVRKGDLYTIASNGKRLARLTSLAATTANQVSGPMFAWAAYYTAYSPDSRQIALLASYSDDAGVSTYYALEVVNLHGRRVRQNVVLAFSTFEGSNPDVGPGGAAGISWQPFASRPCDVPNVLGMQLARAKVRLMAARCSLGKVASGTPKAKLLVVGSESPAPGSFEPGGTPVSLVLHVPSLAPRDDLDAVACPSPGQCTARRRGDGGDVRPDPRPSRCAREHDRPNQAQRCGVSVGHAVHRRRRRRDGGDLRPALPPPPHLQAPGHLLPGQRWLGSIDGRRLPLD